MNATQPLTTSSLTAPVPDVTVFASEPGIVGSKEFASGGAYCAASAWVSANPLLAIGAIVGVCALLKGVK